MRIAIVEDEKHNRDLLIKYIDDFGKSNGVNFVVDTFSDGLEFLASYKPVYALVFMDIKMPNIDGMETAKRLREIDNEVVLIFITNLLNYAIRGYEVGAFDFVLKPVGYADFSSRMKKFLKRFATADRQELVILSNNTRVRVAVEDILWLEVDGHNIIYHLADCEYTVRGSLVKAERELPDCFEKCNSGILVNLNYVQCIEKDSVCVFGNWLPISRPKKKSFSAAAVKYIEKK